ncbi:MAG: choice-of-anchor D domain-containing protein [Candidatus Cloacimonetes bacterium]|nr:choice-of-anchor D domain-containing protein [Candidatus Cloacimonadota bacterium]
MQIKKSVIVLLIISFSLLLMAAQIEINVSGSQNKVKVLQSNYEKLIVNFEYESIRSFEVNTKKGVFNELAIPGAHSIGELGTPKLPAFKKLIEIPFGAEVSIRANSFDTEEFQLTEKEINNKIFPVQPSLPKSIEDPSTVKFEYFENIYKKDQFVSPKLVVIEILGVMRGVRIARITVAPVEYNPITNVIKTYNNIEVEVSFTGADIELSQNIKASTYSPYFKPVYDKLLSRVDHDYPSHPDLVTYPVKYAIVADRMFESTLQSFIDWKTQSGFEVVIGYTDVIGSTSATIQSWVHNQYSAGTPSDPAPSFVLFVGDTGQVPASATGSSSNKATDLYYGSVDGDYFPEMYYGRMSATNTTQLQAQIDKILYYEKYEFADPTYLNDVTLIAGADATWNPNVGQATIQYGTQNYFNAAHGFDRVNDYLTSYTGCYDTVDNGIGFINYTAHCGQTSWGTPSLSQSDVNSFTNVGKYPLAIGNCCLAADFGYSECIGETWLRKANGGAVGYIGSSPSSYWFEDFYWAVGAFPISGNNDGYVPTYDETTWGAYDAPFMSDYVCQDAMIFVGNLAVTEVDLQGYPQHSSPLYYWQAYNTLGDPSLVPYMTQGSVNTTSWDAILPIGATTFQVTAEAGSYVAISMNNVLHGAALVDASGVVDVTIDSFTAAGTADIIITKPQYQPVISTVTIAALSGPYVSIESYTVSAGGDDVIEYGETVYVTTTLENVGTDPATNVTMNVSETDAYITLSDSNESFGTIAAGASVTRTNAYIYAVSNTVPDNHGFSLSANITCNEYSWTSSMNFTAYAPVVEISAVVISDGDNNRLDPGDTANIVVTLENSGGAEANSLNALFSTTNSYITINDNSDTIASLSSSATGNVTFNVTVSPSAPIGSSITFDVDVTADNFYANSDSFTETVGLNLENYESGDFTSYNWTNGGDGNWSVVTESPSEGTYCAKSGTITHSQTTELILEAQVSSDGVISFYRKVSSESSYDDLHFYIDGVQQDEWSGEVAWSEVSYAVTAGVRTFKWSYEKDVSVDSGSDCAWIDYIIFPSFQPGSPAFALSPTSLNFGDVIVGNTSTQQFTISNNGLELMTGDISTSTGYGVTIGAKGSKNSKETISYSIPAGSSETYDLEFAPTASQTYSGNVVITSNDPDHPTNNLSITGTGVAAPDIDLNHNSFDVSLAPDATTNEYLQISNLGGTNLDFGITIEDPAKSTGGPDTYGYSWIDSNEAGGPSYNWVEISSVGTSLTMSDDDNEASLALGFDFSYYGNSYSTINVCSNGWLSFTSTNTTYTNATIPGSSDPNNVLALFWDDLNPTSGGNIYYYADNTNNRFIVEYDQIQHYGTTYPGTYTMQAIIYQNGDIVYQYKTMLETLDSATIGIENSDGTDGLQVVYNASYVTDGLAILFSTDSATSWLNIDTNSGSIAPSGNETITLSIDTAGMEVGTYTKNLVVTSNDPDEASITIPVNLNVNTGGNPQISVNISSHNFGDVHIGSSSTTQFTISNPGTGTLIGPITTPAGYSVNESVKLIACLKNTKKAEKDIQIRDVLSYNVAAGASKDFDLIFEPTAIQAYNGTVQISHNITEDPNVTISLTGNGIAAPTPEIVVSPLTLSTNLTQNSTTSQNIQISNIGNAVLNYSANISYNRDLVRDSRAYCTSTFSNTDDDYITNVTFNTINNSTGQEGADSYGDYTSISTDVIIGETYNLSVSFFSEGTWTEYVKAWIDWNQDEVFDETGESYELGSGVDATLNMNITVPVDAVIGSTRMRVSERYTQYPTACEVSTYGEVEDYTLNVQSNATSNWLSLDGNDSTSGSVIASSNGSILVGYDSTDLELGTYTADIVITSNDTGEPTTTVNVTLNVTNTTNEPDWQPVVYPNNSATLYGILTIDGNPAGAGDKVGAFVGGECRSLGYTQVNEGTAYITLVINVASNGEIVTFEVYDVSEDLVRSCNSTTTADFGQIIGSQYNLFPIYAGIVEEEVYQNSVSTDDPIEFDFDGGSGSGGSCVNIDPPNDGNPDGGTIFITQMTTPPAGLDDPANALNLWFDVDGTNYTGGFPVSVTIEWDNPAPASDQAPELLYSIDDGATWHFVEEDAGITVTEWDLINTDGDNYSVTYSTDHFSQWVMGNGESSPLQLPIPQNVDVSQASNDLNLNWDAVAGATSYQIFSTDEPNGTFTQIGISPTNSYTVTNGALDSKKFFYIKAEK